MIDETSFDNANPEGCSGVIVCQKAAASESALLNGERTGRQNPEVRSQNKRPRP
jgi:hypothetical protein